MTELVNNDINKFENILKIFKSTFLKTIKSEGGLLSEIETIKQVPNTLFIPTGANTDTYNTTQFANFIRNIINFRIINYDNINTTNNNMVYVKKIVLGASTTYDYNDNVKKHIIETLKVINVFVDILEAYKNCIDSEPIVSGGYTSGYTNDIEIEQIELVSNTTRFYNGGSMYPGPEIKNVGYIRPITQADGTTVKNVLYLSIESFYTGMTTTAANKYDYNNMFTKTKIDSANSIQDIISNDILPGLSKLAPTTSVSPSSTTYARQKYSGSEANSILETNLSLDTRNKNLIIYLLKILFNLDKTFRKQCVKALYYYYKFIQLYSTLVINVSNIMYTNTFTSGNTGKCIETLNMSLMNMSSANMEQMSRVVSGIEISTQGAGYTVGTTPTIRFTEGGGTGKSAVPTQATASFSSVPASGVPTTFTYTKGSGYVNLPTITTTVNSGTPTTVVVISGTIVPIAIENNQIAHDDNINNLKTIITDIGTSLTTLNNEFTTFATNNSDINILITTPSNENSGTQTKVSLTSNNNVLITVQKSSIITSLFNLINNNNEIINNDDIINNYIVHDKINIQSYSILKIISENNGNYKITLNAVFVNEDLPDYNIDTKVFKANDNKVLSKPDDSSTYSTYSKVCNTSISDFLVIKKKDLNTYKNEYINNRDDIDRLNEQIRINLNKVEHQKNLYNTQYNKNVFLTRQIISYNTIIAVILIILITINMLNVDTLFIKTSSLVCLGVVLLLFAVYFLSNITYIETFGMANASTGISDLDTLKRSKFSTPAYWDSQPSQTEYNVDKIKILNGQINTLNKSFIGFFEKLIITLPTSDNVDFYKEVKGIITNDKDSKEYTNNVLLLNKDDADNNIDILKYEIENNKLYIVSLLIATIVFLSIYNLYINYVSNDRFLSLTVFICVIILVVIASYYVIRSNRRVRTFHKNIYWGPEKSVRF